MAVCVPHLVFHIAGVFLLGDFFLFNIVLQNVNPVFALRRAGKADVTFVVTALSSSLPLLNEEQTFR